MAVLAMSARTCGVVVAACPVHSLQCAFRKKGSGCEEVVWHESMLFVEQAWHGFQKCATLLYGKLCC